MTKPIAMEDRNDEESESRRQKEQDFSKLIDEYQGVVRSIICAKIGSFNSEAVDDVAQETWIDVWKDVDEEQPVTWTAAYVGTIARRRSIDWIRKSVCRQKANEEYANDLAEDETGERFSSGKAFSAPNPLAIPGEIDSHLVFFEEHVDQFYRLNAKVAEFCKLSIQELHDWRVEGINPPDPEYTRLRQRLSRFRRELLERSKEILRVRKRNDRAEDRRLSDAFFKDFGITINEYNAIFRYRAQKETRTVNRAKAPAVN